MHVLFQVKCVVETRDQDHANKLEAILREHYGQVVFGVNEERSNRS